MDGTTKAVLVAHVFVFAAWFGTDLATFSLSRQVLRADLPVATRVTVARAMLAIEVIARLCLPTMLALGLVLAAEQGWASYGTGWNALWLLVLVAWLALVWTIYRSEGSPLGRRLVDVDLGVRAAVCAAVLVAGVASVVDLEPFRADWLGWKVVLFGVIMLCGITIRFLLKPFTTAFTGLVGGDESVENQRAMERSLRRARPFVVVIWIALLGAAALGVLQSQFPGLS